MAREPKRTTSNPLGSNRVREYRARTTDLHQSRLRLIIVARQKHSIALRGTSGYNVSLPKIEQSSLGGEWLLKSEFEKYAKGLANLYGIADENFPAFRISLHGLVSEFGNVQRGSVKVDAIELPSVAPVRYVNRPDLSMDPVTFLRKYWGKYMDAGILYQDILGHLDPELIPNVRSYCQRMAKRDTQNASLYVAKHHLPPPRRVRLDRMIENDPDLARRMIEERRARNNKNRLRKSE